MKIKKSKFQLKVESMTGKEILLAMIESLENPMLQINMNTFGSYSEGICFGCAATNTICKLRGKRFSPTTIIGRTERANVLHVSEYFLYHFEEAIDSLRGGNILYYNDMMPNNQINCKQNSRVYALYELLPVLRNTYTKEDLQKYKDFAAALD